MEFEQAPFCKDFITKYKVRDNCKKGIGKIICHFDLDEFKLELNSSRLK